MRKLNILIKVFAIVGIVAAFSSCKKDPEVGGTAVQKMAGEWFVTVDQDSVVYTMDTYNTSDNKGNEMWIGPLAYFVAGDYHPLAVKGKITVDLNSMSFSGTNVTNVLEDTNADIPNFSVANGKIITNGAKGPVSKTPTDSISFDLQINGVTHKVQGYHRTGFLLDEPTD